MNTVTPTVDNSAPNLQRATYHNFDGLRLALALSVLALHTYNRSPFITHAAPFKDLFFAVPCFLAISGFLILQSFERSANWMHFASKRIFRVGPAFLISLPLTGLLMGAPSVNGTLRTWATLGLGTDIHNPGNGVVWSLSWEEVYYILLAVLFLSGAYKRPLAIWATFAISIGVSALYLKSEPDIAVLGPAFWLGNLVYMHRERLRRVPRNGYLAAFLIVASCYGLRGHTMPEQFEYQMILVLTFICAAAFGPNFMPRPRVDLSYGIYLYHLPILMYLIHLGCTSNTPALFCLTAAFTASVSAMSWYLVERRFVKLGHRIPLQGIKAAGAATSAA